MGCEKSGAMGGILKTIVPYFGGKGSIASQIVSQMGQHHRYWELCCGSLAVLFNKSPCTDESINDLNGDVTNLARVLQSDQWQELQHRMDRTIFCEDLFRTSRRRLLRTTIHSDELEWAYDFLVVSWIGRRGLTGLPNKKQTYGFSAHLSSNKVLRWRRVMESASGWHERLKNVQITHRDMFKIIPKIRDEKGVVIYLDPPYITKTTDYAVDFSSRKSFNQHKILAEMLSKMKHCRILVSYYDHPKLEKYYSGWTKISLKAMKVMGALKKREMDMSLPMRVEASPEVLLINGPEITSQSLWDGA